MSLTKNISIRNISRLNGEQIETIKANNFESLSALANKSVLNKHHNLSQTNIQKQLTSFSKCSVGWVEATKPEKNVKIGALTKHKTITISGQQQQQNERREKRTPKYISKALRINNVLCVISLPSSVLCCSVHFLFSFVHLFLFRFGQCVWGWNVKKAYRLCMFISCSTGVISLRNNQLRKQSQPSTSLFTWWTNQTHYIYWIICCCRSLLFFTLLLLSSSFFFLFISFQYNHENDVL